MRSSHSQTAPVSRRRFLKQSALAAGALAVPAAPFVARAATALKPVTFTLDWLYQGASAGFLVAHEKGFYRDAGLDVSILAGKGSGTTAQLVASKAAPIGFSDGFVVANSVAKGMAIKTRRHASTGAIRPPSWCWMNRRSNRPRIWRANRWR